jgi:hypothetical protein
MKYHILIIILVFGLVMAALAGIGLILTQKDTSSSSVCQDTAGYHTFHNSNLSFQYPPNLTVTELDSNTVQINTGHPVDGQNGIFIQVMGKSQYLAAKDKADSNWQLEYELENSGGISYQEYSRTSGNLTIYRYLFSKNGKYYDMYGNVEDDYLMVQLLDSVQ